MEKKLWAPIFNSGYTVSARLDGKYTKRLAFVHGCEDFQRKMNQLGISELENIGIKYDRTYGFFQDTPLISSVNIGLESSALSITEQDIERYISKNKSKLQKMNEKDYIEYIRHNIDTSEKSFALLKLFSHWYDNVIRIV